MNYTQGAAYMRDLYRRGWKEPFVVHQFMRIHPGKKQPGDYQLELLEQQHVPTHPDMCEYFYRLIVDQKCTYRQMVEFLEHTYQHGTSVKYHDTRFHKLQKLTYWITLQEEINYPRTKGMAGINLPYCRYFEAVCSTQDIIPSLTLNKVLARCNNHGGAKPLLYEIDNPPSFYTYTPGK